MENGRKQNDCYFYYYSKCTKGDTCPFRHEPSALGCETMCYHWQQGNCTTQGCKFRHMELKKNRKQIPCYWEMQPGGCLKKHCPFMHKSAPGGSAEGLILSQQMSQVGQQLQNLGQDQGNILAMRNEMIYPAFQRPSRRPMVMDPTKVVGVPPGVLAAASHNSRTNPDPLLVHIEEESDNESAPSTTPVKVTRVKTLEQIRLERIQAESAAYYSYEADVGGETRYDRRHVSMSLDEIDEEARCVQKRKSSKPSDDFRILSLDEIRAKRRKANDDENVKPVDDMDGPTVDRIGLIDDETLTASLKSINVEPVGRCRRPKKKIDRPAAVKPKLNRNRNIGITTFDPKDSDDLNNKLDENLDSNLNLAMPDVIFGCDNAENKNSNAGFSNILEDMDKFLDDCN